MTPWTTYESPLGVLTLRGGPRGLSALEFPGAVSDEAARDEAPFAEAIAQLDEYFAGRRREFTLALEIGGTAFQRAVWERVLEIPYAETITYGELAAAIGRPDRLRAAAATVGRTPVPIVMPCHRVLGAGGALTGYGGGLQRKRALLDLEQAGCHQLALL